MDKNLAKLSKTIGEAASGSKQASDLFKKMNIELKDGNELKSTEKILFEVANKFKELPAGAERATLAMDLFGKSGASMVTMLKDGEAGLKAMSDQGKAAAGDVEGIAESMQKLKDAGTKASAALTGMIATLANDEIFQSAINFVNELSDSFLKWRAASKDEKEKEKTQNVKDLTESYKQYSMQLAEVAKAEAALGFAKENGLTKTTVGEKQKELAAAQGAIQIATIQSQKFASGGIVRGGPRLISINEEGEEGILSTGGLRRLGGAAALNALNNGSYSTVNNNSTSNSTVVINTAIMTQKAYRDEILPVMRAAERRR